MSITIWIAGFTHFFIFLFIFQKQLYIASWGANIRMSVATVVVFWVPIEILGRINFFKEFWTHPQEYAFPLLCILAGFLFLLGFMWLKGSKKKRS